jgi:hypothetical protein
MLSCCFLLLNRRNKIAATINERINNPLIDATIGTTILFFLHEPDPHRFGTTVLFSFLHEPDPHRFGLSITLEN